mgnify:FL=1
MRGKISHFYSNIEIYKALFSFCNTKEQVCRIFKLPLRIIMILKKISIINYKNILQANLTLSEKLNCFVGSNGVGKTNLLDAVYFMSFCHSSFTNLDSMVINHAQDFFVIEGDYLSENSTEERIYAGMKRGKHKHFKRNGKDYKRLSMHIGMIPLVFISPADNSLVTGGGEERRKLLDVVIAQLDNSYIDALNRYNKALQQRNALLKSISETDMTLMQLLEEEMARNGEIVYKKRDELVNELTPTFQEAYSQISGGRENVSLRYVSHCQRGPLLDVIQRDRFRDRAVGYSLHGTHRDDLEMLIDGYPIRREGSQGQTKTYVLALKLAQFAYLKRKMAGKMPLLLLDDIFDKLDANRVEQIIHLVADNDFGQIFITDTNREHLDKILSHADVDYKLFDVKDGEITERAN